MRVYSIISYIEMLNEANLLVDSYVVEPIIGIENITYNSKEARPLTLFACKGAAFKSQYLDEAIENGADCYLSEVKYQTKKNISYILVSDVRKAMAIIANTFYDNAYEKINLIGITGTKGKSTTAYYIKYILDEYLQSKGSKPSGIISSIDTFDGVINEESHLTTPEAFLLHKHFDNAVKSELEFLEMEVSSQALKYDRVLGVKFDVAVFLNISEDHISPVEHSDFEDYLSSKLKIFQQSKLAVVNINSDYSERILKSAKDSDALVTFGLDEQADFFAYNIRKADECIKFNVKTNVFDEEFVLTMPGLFNVENALASIAVCVHYNIPLEIIKSGLKKARSSGRMEIYSTKDKSIITIVDYAHNKLSFEKLYQSTQEEYKGRKIITVFGCPGGKAYNRRVELGTLSGKYSDKVYLTAEDPAYEKVSDISDDIEKYVLNNQCECYKIEDRGEAIKEAILNAEPNSIILITGKGNETRQKINSEYVPCLTDADYAKMYLQQIEQVLKKK